MEINLLQNSSLKQNLNGSLNFSSEKALYLSPKNQGAVEKSHQINTALIVDQSGDKSGQAV